MATPDHVAWLNTLTGGDSITAVARKIGMNRSTLYRRLTKEAHLTAEDVIAIARAYRQNPLIALTATGYLTGTEIATAGMGPAEIAGALAAATNQQILQEIMRRVDPEAHRLFGSDDDEPTTGGDAHGAVIPLHPPEWLPPEGAVADEAPDEPGPGEDGYHDGP